MSSFCSQCGTEIQSDSKFCPACGAPLPNIVQTGNESPFPITASIKTNMMPPLSSGNQALETMTTPMTSLPGSRDPDFLLMLSLLCISVFPGILESLMMLIAKQAIGMFLVTMTELIGLALGGLIFGSYLVKATGNSVNKGSMIHSMNGILWMFAIGTGTMKLMSGMKDFAFTRMMDIYWLYIVLMVVLIIAVLVALTLIAYRTIVVLTAGTVAGIPANPLRLIRQPRLFWFSLLLVSSTVAFAPELISMITRLDFLPIPLSFVSTVSVNIIVVFVQVLLLRKLVNGMVRSVQSQGANYAVQAQHTGTHQHLSQTSLGTGQEYTSGLKHPYIMPIIAAGAVLIILGTELIGPVFYTTINAIETSVQRDINYGSTYLAAGDIEMAVSLYDRAYAHAQAWLAFAGETEENRNQLITLYNANPSDEMIAYLLAVKTFSVSELEKTVVTERTSTSWYLTLLSAYHAQEKNKDNLIPLTDKQEAIRKDLLNDCIAAECFVNDAITMKDIKGKEKKINTAMKPYMEFISYYGSFRILDQVSQNGDMSADIMNQLLQYSEDNTENMLAQYMAYAAGSTYLYDAAPHYQRTADAAKRFGRLYMAQTDKKASPNIAIGIQMEVANALMAVHDYRGALTYLEDAVALGAKGDVRMLAAQCYESLEDYDKCFEMASAAAKENPADGQALHLAMVSGLKSGKITESMKIAIQLLDLLPTLKGDAYLEADAGLYLFIQYFTVQDETQWTPQMKFKVYPNLDTEQQQILDQNVLFADYVKAMHFTFDQKDFDQALQLIQNLLDKLPESPQIQYLAGTVYFNRREFPAAVKAYEASLTIDNSAPTVWYALANAYDGLEQYQEAYNCTLKVAEILQYNNHAVDIYGVQYHNNALMVSLAQKLEQGGAGQ